MSFRALRIAAGLGQAQFVRSDLGPDPGQTLAAARRDAGPVAFVVREADLPRLDACRDLLVDRGRKHPAKPLATLLLGHGRIPLIRGGYTAPGQLLRGLRALLVRATSAGDGNVFVVATEETPFEEAWRRARAEAGVAAPGRPRAAPAPASASGPGSATRVLFDLLPELPVPPPVRERFVGGSPDVRLVHQLVLRAAQQDRPVLVLGDTGTGKEVVARLIHDQSGRRLQPFVAVNCGAIPRELLESELFGYEKGAHSTATTRKVGLWRSATGGTLFLDEIADLSLDHQVKIFRALEHGELRPVGADQAVQVDARVIAATNRDLFGMMRAGAFREDLYYRLRAFMIRTPALRDHPEDLAELANHFWRRIARDPAATLPEVIVEELGQYRWPGNARELKMVLSTLHGLFGPAPLEARHLRAVFEFEGQAGTGMDVARAAAPDELGRHRAECLRHLRRADEVLRAAAVALRPLTDPAADSEARAASATVIGDRVTELELLCRFPLLFHGEATFRTVRDLTDGLRSLHPAGGADGDPDARCWSAASLEPRFAEAESAIFREVQRLLA